MSQDLPRGALDAIREFLGRMPHQLAELRSLMDANPLYLARTKNVAYLDLAGCMALGVTGPLLRGTGLPWDLRKSQPYCGYETYDFEVPHPGHLRRLRPVPGPGRRVRRVAEDHRAGRGPAGRAAARARPGDDQ